MKLITLSGHERKLTKVMFNNDDDLVFTAAADKIVNVWDSDTGERLGTYDGHNGIINDFDVNHNSQYLLTGSGGSSICICEVETGKNIHKFQTYAPVVSVQWSCGNKLFLAACRKFDNQQSCVHIYNNPTMIQTTLTNTCDKPITTISINNDRNQSDFSITKGIWSPLNQQIFALCTDNTIRIIDVVKGIQIKKVIFDKYTYNKRENNELEMQLTDFRYNCNDYCTAVICSRNKQAKMYEICNINSWDKPICSYNCDMELNTIAIHPKLNIICMGGGQKAQMAALKGNKGKYDPVFYHKIFEEQIGIIETNCFSPLNSMDWSHDGTKLILGYEQGEAQLFTMNVDFERQFNKRERAFISIPKHQFYNHGMISDENLTDENNIKTDNERNDIFDDIKTDNDIGVINNIYVDDNCNVEIVKKLSDLEGTIMELYKIKLEMTSLYEIQNHKDFKLQSKKEQEQIIEIVDRLKDMKNLSNEYFELFAKKNKWAQHLLDTFDNVLFRNNKYDAYE